MPEGTGGKPGEPGPPGPPGPPGLGADGKQVRSLCERTDGQHENVHKLNQLKFIEKHTERFLEIGTCLIIFFESILLFCFQEQKIREYCGVQTQRKKTI